MNKTTNQYINQLNLDPKREAAVRKLVEGAGGVSDSTPLVESLVGNELIPIKQDGENKAVSVEQIKNNVLNIKKVLIPNGVYIYDIDGNCIEPNKWNTANNNKAVGVAIVHDNGQFVVAKEDIGKKSWGGLGTDINGLTNYDSKAEAANDFYGITNTKLIIETLGVNNAPAAEACTLYSFLNGQTGYLGAAGEWQFVANYKDELNLALELIGGNKITEDYYWTSTEKTSFTAYQQFFGSTDFLDYDYKDSDYVYVRAFLAIDKPYKIISPYDNIQQGIIEFPSKYEFVDLGLPSGTKWATTNIGAVNPEDAGLYFAWGETEGYTAEDVTAGKKAFSWNDYKFGTQNNLTKYNATDGLTQLELIDDAAYQSDNTCRMPTKDELQELVDNTTSNWETLNGVNGRRFTSTNGNSIFVPAAGGCGNGSVFSVGSSGGLCSSSLSESSSRGDWVLGFNSGYAVVNNSNRCDGLMVRPVQPANIPTTINLKELQSTVDNIKIQAKDAKEVYSIKFFEFKTPEDFNKLKTAVDAGNIIIVDGTIINNLNEAPDGTFITVTIIVSFPNYSGDKCEYLNLYQSITFNSDGTRNSVINRINLRSGYEGTKFLADDGSYKETELDYGYLGEFTDLNGTIPDSTFNNKVSQITNPFISAKASFNFDGLVYSVNLNTYFNPQGGVWYHSGTAHCISNEINKTYEVKINLNDFSYVLTELANINDVAKMYIWNGDISETVFNELVIACNKGKIIMRENIRYHFIGINNDSGGLLIISDNVIFPPYVVGKQLIEIREGEDPIHYSINNEIPYQENNGNNLTTNAYNNYFTITSNKTFNIIKTVNNFTHIYEGEFNFGDTLYNVTFPNEIKWSTDSVLEYKANHTYQFRIVNGLGVMKEFANS